MSSFKPFGYQGLPGTCLWCGDRLRYQRVLATDEDRADPSYKPASSYEPATVRAEKPGRYWDGFFCGLGCGYRYGKRMAELGNRLEARP